jgi:hypothetical protein
MLETKGLLLGFLDVHMNLSLPTVTEVLAIVFEAGRVDSLLLVNEEGYLSPWG